ncbi:MAG: VWA domain-containing protein, partial [Alphaproteobacteria bacterium]|nr:VWA domain-containing protein [Alphaproteobacteria bacterium]
MTRAMKQHRPTLAARGLAFTLAATLGLTPALACQEEAMLVFDASGSMQMERDGLPKIDIARDAAAEVLPELTRSRPTGLVTYGGEQGDGCKSVTLRLPPMTGSGDLIIGELAALQPSGSTPLTEAVWTAALTLKSSGKPGTVVLITDGKENCGYNACTFAQQMTLGARNIKVHVIGFYLHANAET